MAHVKGSSMLARLRFLDERFGPAALASLSPALTPASRAAVEAGFLPHAWVDYDVFVDLNVAIDRLFGKGDLALCEAMGAHAAEVNLPTLYRIFYRLSSPNYLFRKAARLWEVHYDSGRLVPWEEGPPVSRLRIVDFERPHRAHCLAVKGWAVRSIEMSGAQVLASSEDRCRTRGDPDCEISLTWR